MDFKKYLRKAKKISRSIRLESCLGVNDYWALLFIGCISLFEHKLIYLALIYVVLKTHRRAAVAEIRDLHHELEKIVLYIHMDHLQSLKDAIESNPEILYYEHRKRNLLAWCKFYNNTKAIVVITQMTQKYPKEKLLAA